MNLKFEELYHLTCKAIPFVEKTGLELLEARRGYVKFKMPLKGNENHIQTMYVGAQCVLTDLPGGTLFLTAFDNDKYFPVVKEMTVRYRKMAKTDLTIEGSLSEAEIARIQEELNQKGKSDFIIDFEILDTNKVAVTTSTVTFTALKRR